MEENIGLVGIMKREFQLLASKRIYWFIMLIAPACCFVFFADLLKEGLPSQLPIAVVDEDDSFTSRELIRSLNAFAQTEIVLKTADFKEARQAMQRAEIYGIFHIPAGFKKEVAMGKEPVVSFYTNETYLLPSSLAYKDMRMQAALANGAVQRTLLLAKGEGKFQLQAKLMPVVVDTNPLNNPWLSYAIYLASILMPAFVFMFSMFTAAYSIGEEMKRHTAVRWLEFADNSIMRALIGKLLPQAFVFFSIGLLCLGILYGFLQFPLNSGFGPMAMAMVLLVLSGQGLAVFFMGVFKRNRLVLSACALWAVLSFSISGFTYPVPSMPPLMQGFAVFFPLRHYYLLYVDQALNGIPLFYSWKPYLALIVFIMLPLVILGRLKRNLAENKYLL